MLVRIHLPRWTGEVRFGYDVTVRMLALPQQPAARRVGHSNPPELASVDAGNPVMLRQTLVYKGVIRVHQVHHAAIFVLDAFKEQLGFLEHGLAEVIVEIGEIHQIGRRVLEIAQEQPLFREIVGERVRARVDQHALHLLFENCRILEFALGGKIQQRVVRYAAPQEKRQPRSQGHVINAIRRAGGNIGRVGLETEQEFGTRQDELERGFDPGVEAALIVAAALIETEGLLEIAVFERPSISMARQIGEDLARAGQFLFSGRRAGRRRSCGGTPCLPSPSG